MPLRLALLALLAGAAAPAAAADPAACPAPADLGGTPLAPWAAADGDAAGPLAPGRAVTLAMTEGAVTRSLHIASAGRYGVAADGKVWIDLIANGRTLASVDHGHGPACSGIRKIVWFDLVVGDYDLALTKGETASVRALVVRAP